jgi:hypothetical protein
LGHLDSKRTIALPKMLVFAGFTLCPTSGMP